MNLIGKDESIVDVIRDMRALWINIFFNENYSNFNIYLRMKIPYNSEVSKFNTGHEDSVPSYNTFKRFLDMTEQ